MRDGGLIRFEPVARREPVIAIDGSTRDVVSWNHSRTGCRSEPGARSADLGLGARKRLHVGQRGRGLFLLAERKGPKPKLIHLERYDFPFRVVEEMLRRNAIRISEFERAPADYLLIIRCSSIQGFR